MALLVGDEMGREKKEMGRKKCDFKDIRDLKTLCLAFKESAERPLGPAGEGEGLNCSLKVI